MTTIITRLGGSCVGGAAEALVAATSPAAAVMAAKTRPVRTVVLLLGGISSCDISHAVRDRYDFVIVGGGSAGSVLANRLSADPSTSVLVLEAGRPDSLWDVFIHMPAALAFPIGSRFYDWRYESEPEPHMHGRRIYHARGKVLGGSSSVNGVIFERGPARGPLYDAFFAAVQEAGHPLTDDVNGYRQEGFAAFDRNVHRGRRLSAARAYLHPVMSRPNLDVVTLAQVLRVRFDGARATGVDYTRGRP